MKTPEATMRQRAREIIEEMSKFYGDDLPDYELFLMKKIAVCNEIELTNTINWGGPIVASWPIKIDDTGESCYDTCPFPKKDGANRIEGRGGCYSCVYFFKGIATNHRPCVWDLIEDGAITIDQVIHGLRIFKKEMKKYKQRCPGISLKKTVKTTIRQRALEIIEEASEGYPFFNLCLREKIEHCDKVAEALKKKRPVRLCTFPNKKGPYGNSCCSCDYFFGGTTDGFCGCDLIEIGAITINQAINGLRIFKNEMEKYLKEKQQCPGV